MFAPYRLALLVACLVSLAASPAMAQQYSRISNNSTGYQPAHGGYLTMKLQMVMYTDDSGTEIIDQYDCPALSNCLPGFNGSFGSYRVTLVNPDDPSLEILSSYCLSAPGVPSTECFNDALRVNTKMRYGNLRIQLVGADQGRPFIEAGAQFRYQIRDTAYYWSSAAGGHMAFPVGSWTPTIHTAPPGHCRPQPVNPAPVFTVEEGTGNPTYNWEFYGTICDMYVDSPSGGGTVIDLNSDFTCVMPAGKRTRCAFEVPFGEVARFQAIGDSGYTGFMRRIGGPCDSSEPDVTICQWTPKENRDINVDFYPVSNDAAASASAGSNGPLSRLVPKGSTDVAVQQVHLATTGGAAVTQVVVGMTGTGSTEDILGVKVYIDANGNGSVDEGETLAGEGAMGAGTAAISIDAAAIGSGLTLLVAVDFNSTIQAGVTIPGAPWILLLIAVGSLWALLPRRRVPTVAVGAFALALALATSIACGDGKNSTGDGDGDGDNTGDGDGDNTGDGDGDGDNTGDGDGDNTGDGDGDDTGGNGGENGDGDGDMDPNAKTYSFSITGITGTETVSGGPAFVASGLPLVGATISVLP